MGEERSKVETLTQTLEDMKKEHQANMMRVRFEAEKELIGMGNSNNTTSSTTISNSSSSSVANAGGAEKK